MEGGDVGATPTGAIETGVARDRNSFYPVSRSLNQVRSGAIPGVDTTRSSDDAARRSARQPMPATVRPE